MTTGALLTHGLVRPARVVLALNAALFVAYFAVVSHIVDLRVAEGLVLSLIHI